MDNVINIVLDEAHVVKEWGGTFRTDYTKLGPLRYRFPWMIPYHAGSATVGNEMESELVKNLHLRKDSLAVMRCNTDRPNIFLVVKRMKHPANSYEDLAFLIKKNLGPGDESPPKFLVFFNSRAEAQAGAEYLRARLSPELRDKIKWFHSGMTDEFREEEMHALIIGESFGEGSTDAAGMVSLLALRLLYILTCLQGIDIPDIRIVVQYGASKELSTYWQRAGRAGRDYSIDAVAILLVEPRYFDDEKEKMAQKAAEKTAGKRTADGQLQPASSKRSRTGATSRSAGTAKVPSDSRKLDKAMDDYINAERRPGKCRRKGCNDHFGNNNLRS